MGQRELLIIVLVTIIAGIATVVATKTFSRASESANIDAVRQDLLDMAAASQQYYLKPEVLGGGGQDFDGIGFKDISLTVIVGSATSASNKNGTYSMSTPSGGSTSFKIDAIPADAGGSISIEVFADSSAMSDYDPSGSL